MPLFEIGKFRLASGFDSTWRINAEALDSISLAALANLVAIRAEPFSTVEGVPTGGLALAEKLRPYAYRSVGRGLLIVDDVLTTGLSMEAHRAGRVAEGWVLFDRSGAPRPPWIKALWTLAP